MKTFRTRVACAMLLLSMVVSLPLGLVFLQETKATLLPMLAPMSLYALLVSLVVSFGFRAHRTREVSWGPFAVCLVAVTALAVMGVMAADPKGAPDLVAIAARLLVFATYAPLCSLMATILCRSMRRRSGFVMGLAIHALAVLFVAYDPSCARGICVPHVAWMSLCWALFAFPALAKPYLDRIGARGTAALAGLSFVVSFLSLSSLDLFATLRLPSVIVRLVARAAIRPDMAVEQLRLAANGIARSWQDVVAVWGNDSSAVEACWLLIVLLVTASVISCWVLWQDARRSDGRKMEQVLALGVLLSNVWGLACILFRANTGVGVLLWGNPFQLVPVACLLALEHTHLHARGSRLISCREHGLQSLRKAKGETQPL